MIWYFLVIKWVFSVQILIVVTLMILNMMEIILKLLVISEFRLGIVNLKNAKHLRKDKQKINVNSVASKKWWNFCMPEDEKKRSRTDLY